MEKFKKIAVVSVFLLFIFGFFLLHLILPDVEFSAAERKPLAQVPELTGDGILTGDYFTDAETYLLEQFPLRQEFLNCKQFVDKNIFLMSSSGGYAAAEDHLTKIESTTDEAQIQYTVDLINRIIDKYPELGKAYYAVIPDKNYYLSQITKQPTIDYEKIFTMAQGIKGEKIELTPLLTLEDYYRTDSHWRQERILPVAEALCQAMGVQPADPNGYKATVLEGFRGVYYALTNTPPDPETLIYLRNDAIDNAVAHYMGNSMQMEQRPIYNEENFNKELTDSYDVFLDGPESVITIENPYATSDKHLILIRDSFGSSLAPLLVDSYAKITVLDLRYIGSNHFSYGGVDFTGADVLFLFSTNVFNSGRNLGLK
ncbi:MAG: hypothetical protein IKM59_02395 [Oscillospiraceae bacterium]|nr:hypothetical protein [Oscillospiraceae bacterium]